MFSYVVYLIEMLSQTLFTDPSILYKPVIHVAV